MHDHTKMSFISNYDDFQNTTIRIQIQRQSFNPIYLFEIQIQRWLFNHIRVQIWWQSFNPIYLLVIQI